MLLFVSAEQENELVLYDHFDFHQNHSIAYQQHELNEHIYLLQEWIYQNIDDLMGDEQGLAIFFESIPTFPPRNLVRLS